MGKNARAGKNKTPKSIKQEQIRFETFLLQERMKDYARKCLNKYMLSTLLVLHDEFQFGKVRCHRFLEKLDDTAEAIEIKAPDGSDWLKPSEIYEALSERFGEEWMVETMGKFEDMGLR